MKNIILKYMHQDCVNLVFWSYFALRSALVGLGFVVFFFLSALQEAGSQFLS